MNKSMRISDNVSVLMVEEKETLVLSLSVQNGLVIRTAYLIDEEIIKLRDFLNSEVEELEE